MELLRITLLLALLVLWYQSCGAQNARMDSILYRFETNDSGVLLLSVKDTIHFPRMKKQDFIMKIQSKSLRVENKSTNDDKYILYDSVLMMFFNLPFGIIRATNLKNRQEESFSVIINNRLNKNEEKLTNRDWKIAERRKKQGIQQLKIVDEKSQEIIASALVRRTSDGQISYIVGFNDSVEGTTRIMLRSILFTILWIYQK